MAADGKDPSTFRGDIQGMRALAVLAVVIYHAGAPFLSGGFVGVDIFFVISGYLITLHLIGSLRRDGRIGLLGFYARRVRRLLPAAWLVIIVTLVAARLFAWPLQMEQIGQGALAASTYAINIWFGATGTDYLAGETPNLFQHYWSLAVEEQFYLVWPLLLVATWRLMPQRGQYVLPPVVVVGSLALCVYLTGVSQPWAFFGLPTRMWELGVGGCVAVLVADGLHRRLTTVWASVASASGLSLICYALLAFSHDTVFPGAAAAIPVLGAALLIGGGAIPNVVSRALEARPLQYFGRISYSLYLWHWPLLIAPSLHNIELSVWQVVGVCGVAVVLADVTERFVERPTRFWAGWSGTGRALTGAVAGTATCGLAASVLILAPPTIDHGPAASAAPVRAGEPIRAGSALPENLRPQIEDVSRSIPGSYRTGCHVGVAGSRVRGDCVEGSAGPRVALFGDSHAAQYYPPLASLADAGDLTLLTATKSACPSVGIPVSYGGRDYTACDNFRRNAVARIQRFSPDVVIISNSYFTDDGDERDDLVAWQRELGTLKSEMAPAQLLVVTDGPRVDGVAPAECVSGNPLKLSRCAVSLREFNLELEETESQWARDHDVETLSMRSILCDGSGSCPVVRGRTFVFRDTHHLTTEFAEALAPSLLRELAAAAGR